MTTLNGKQARGNAAGGVPLLTVCSIALLVAGACDEEGTTRGAAPGGDQTSWNYQGSVWEVRIDAAHNYLPGAHAPVEQNDGATRAVYAGQFEVGELESATAGGGKSYALNPLSLKATAEFDHRAGEDGMYLCSAATGERDLSALYVLTGYYSANEQAVPAPAGWMSDGSTTFPKDYFNIWIDINWDFVESGTPNPALFEYECTSESDTWTRTAGIAAPWGEMLIGKATDRTVAWESQSDTDITTVIVTLKCISGCTPPDPPPAPDPPEDDCEPEDPCDRCRSFLDTITNYCKTLEGWMVVLDSTCDGHRFYCETADCGAAIAASENGDGKRWVGIQEQWSAADTCSDNPNDVACSVECYGWLSGP